MKECRNCKRFNKMYTKNGDDFKYEGVGRCTSEKSENSGYVVPDFRSCSRYLARKGDLNA